MNENHIKRIFIIGVFCAAGLGAACQEDKAAATGVAEDPPVTAATPAPTPVLPAQTQEDGDDLIVTGPLVVEQQLELLAQREGMVVSVHADTGKRLAQGELLVQFDDRQIRSELEANRAKTRSIEAEMKSMQAEQRVLQADYDRASKLLEAGLMPKEQVDHAKFKVESEEWDIRRVSELLVNSKETERGLELELEKMQVRAPFAGVVARRYIQEGESVSKGGRLFWFTSEEPLRMRFTAPEKHLNRLKLGERFMLTSPNFPHEPHAARVIQISPVVDPASGTVEAMVELVGPRGSLRSGMTANLVIGKTK